MDTPFPEIIETHLRSILETTEDDWSREAEAFIKLKAVWLRKDRLFEEQVGLLGMEEVRRLEKNDPRGMLFLTYSGSLVSLGYGEERWMEYASIKLRTDVPDIVRTERTRLAADPVVGSSARFDGGPLKNTSSLFRIMVCPSGVSPAEQDKRIREATVFLTNSFIHLNRDLTLPVNGENLQEFDTKHMVSYLAGRHGLSQHKTREILDDYFCLLESGMLLGKTIPLGRLGRLSLRIKPRRKARLGRNPRTGEEITIPAKDAHYSPGFKFTPSLKERTAGLPLPEDYREEDDE